MAASTPVENVWSTVGPDFGVFGPLLRPRYHNPSSKPRHTARHAAAAGCFLLILLFRSGLLLKTSLFERPPCWLLYLGFRIAEFVSWN